MNNNRAHLHSRLSSFSHPASSSSSSSCPSPSPAPTPPLPSSSSPASNYYAYPRDHPVSLLKLQAAQRQHALKVRNFPPLSPQESSTLSFSDSASSNPLPRAEPSRRLPQNGDPLYTQSPQQGISFFFNHEPSSSSSYVSAASTAHKAPPFIHKAKLANNGAICPDIPVVCGPLAVQAPKTSHKLDEDAVCASGTDSKRLKLSLADIEKELLGDDPDIAANAFFSEMATSSFFSDMATSSVVLDACEQTPASAQPDADERDWTDAIEDFLSGESASPTTTIDHSTITSITSNTSTMMPQKAPQSHSTCNPKELLLACANAINNEDYTTAKLGVSSLEQYVSIYGDPMQRLAAHLAEGLVAKMEIIKDGHSDRLAQTMRDASPTENLRSTQLLHHWCLHFKFGYLAANTAIAEACRNERLIHIIDFDIGQGNLWQTLIGAFAQRPGGPPHIRITGVADPRSPTNLVGVEKRLEEVARSAKVPLEFKYIQREASQVEPWMLQVKAGEAVAVNFTFHLHRMADESVSTSNPRDSLLRKVKALQPKIVTLVEHDANTNTAPFYPRFVEALNYFNAIFESLDAALPRDNKERVHAEKYCLGRDIMNIVACEGVDRLQRYEMAGKWRARMMMAGFRSLPTSAYTSRLTKDLLLPYSRKYKLRDEAGTLHLDWLDRSLVGASAWQ